MKRSPPFHIIHSMLSKPSLPPSLLPPGALERPQVVQREGRSCLAVRSGRMGELSRGAVVLGTSKSGQTLFAEPPELVERNNREQGEWRWHAVRMSDGTDDGGQVLLRAVALSDIVTSCLTYALCPCSVPILPPDASLTLCAHPSFQTCRRWRRRSRRGC